MDGFLSVFAGPIFGVLAAVSLGITALLVRKGSQTESGSIEEVVLTVLLINALILAPSVLFIYYPHYALTPQSVVAFIAAGLVASLLGRTLNYRAISLIGASRSEPLKASMPLFSTIFAVFFLGETISLLHLFGILTVITGIIIISIDVSATPSDVSDKTILVRGSIIALIAAMLFGIEPVFAKIGMREGTPAVVGLTIKTIAGLVGILVYQYYKQTASITGVLQSSNRQWYIAAGIANTSFLVAYYLGINIAPVSVVVPIMQTSPVIVVILSYFLFRHLENVTLQLIFGTIIVVLGAALVTIIS